MLQHRAHPHHPTIYIAVKARDAVDRAWCDPAGVRRLRGDMPGPCCVFVFAPTPAGAYSRMFAPEYGIPEDPATGSSTGPLAALMRRHGLTDAMRFVSEQGTKMGRRSLLHIKVTGDAIDIGGHVTPIGEGKITRGHSGT